MKTFLQTCCAFLCAAGILSNVAFSQDEPRSIPKENLLAPAKLNGEWGYIDGTGKWVIQPEYVYAKNFNTGLAEVKIYSGGRARLGLINRNNELVVELRNYNQSKFSEGFLVYKEGDLFGYMNIKGEKVIPAQFSYCGPFRESKAAVQFKEGKMGYIDPSKKLLISPKYFSASDFSEGMATVSKDADAGKRKYGCIDDKGNEVIPFKYIWISPFSESKTFANAGGYIENGIVLEGNWFILDKTGKTIPASADTMLGLEVNSYPYLLNFSNGVSWFPGQVNGKQRYGLIDTNGKWVLEPRYEYVGRISEGRAWVFENNRMGFVNTKGNAVISNYFESVGDFNNGLAWFKDDQKYGVIDRNGKIVIEAKFEEIGDFAEVGSFVAGESGE